MAFFVISGFLITQSFDRNPVLKNYLLSRMLRIFPGLIFAVLISTFILGPLVTSLPLNDYLKHPQTYNYMQGILLFLVQYVLPGVFEDNIYKHAVNGSICTIP
ncbi:hypothetical protein [Ammoniphilus sp. 3BR4]|uniref:hypothetical protein n=1 Tax=Ammoniphilus sp. 3BR4 TaxID=3158265 RepID=UPI003466C163